MSRKLDQANIKIFTSQLDRQLHIELKMIAARHETTFADVLDEAAKLVVEKYRKMDRETAHAQS